MTFSLAEKPHIIYQGEGPHTNKKMVCVRVKGCVVRCNWCDSSYTWDSSGAIQVEFNDILSLAYANKIDNILITGGAPSLYQEEITEFMQLVPFGMRVHIEDAGDLMWDSGLLNNRRIFFSFSPKLFLFDDLEKWNVFYQLDALMDNFICKIVISEYDDIHKILEFQKKFRLKNHMIWLMPCGTTTKTIIVNSKMVANLAIDYSFNFTSRQHILIYDKQRLV